MKLKICGMKYEQNILQAANLLPDYLGFIFYSKSKRYFEDTIPKLPKSVKKVGVFVDESYEILIECVKKYHLQAVQLHGAESAEYCAELLQKLDKLKLKNLALIKVFSVGNDFDFNILEKYELLVNYFLFDTKGIEKGGNGIQFNWQLLDQYPSKKPYFLSGGIGLESLADLKLFLKSPASKYCWAIDVNSRFETIPGLKVIEKLKEFKHHLV